MFWIVLGAGWLLLAPLIAWTLGTAVVLADRANPPFRLDEANEDEACPRETAVQAEFQPELAAAG
jgi:hypothetical protein